MSVIVALDAKSQYDALAIAEQLDPSLCRLKVGKELFTHEGSSVVKALHDQGFEVFLDLKFHDIPNTTAMASIFAAKEKCFMFNVHASGGKKMMKTVNEKVREINKEVLIIAVTILTSLSEEEIVQTFNSGYSLKELALNLAKLTNEAGLNGVVCSPWDASEIKKVCGKDFKTVCPGVRPKWSATNDQERIMTPKEAIMNGCDFLVIGRPITKHEDPKAAFRMILDEVNEGLALV